VGNFEESVNAWRRDAALWNDPNDGVILAAASGAVGVQLGVAEPGGLIVIPESPPDPGLEPPAGAEGAGAATPTAAHLQSMVGLVWRSVVLWMLLVALLTLANVLG
jgi:adenosylcobinamide-phosphate synthase